MFVDLVVMLGNASDRVMPVYARYEVKKTVALTTD